MAHTAAREHFGGSIRMSLAADLHVGLIRGPGCVRLFHLHTSTPGLTVHLPVTGLVAGGEPLLAVINDPDDGVEDIAVGPDITLTPGEMVQCYRTASGWLYDQRAVEVGTGLAIGRIPFHFDLRGSVTNFRPSVALPGMGWDGVSPVALSVTVHENSIVGSTSASVAFFTGTLPSGSTMLLRIKDTGYISGRGGRGGRGGDAGTGLLAQAGAAGGPALRTTIPTVIINEGTIQGGGGGGGGGAASGSVGGAGGGGGAGYPAAQGGSAGSPGGLAGYSGATNIGGPARGSSGAGGSPGSAGSAGSASGGAAGVAIDGYSLCTFIRTGTILGATTG